MPPRTSFLHAPFVALCVGHGLALAAACTRVPAGTTVVESMQVSERNLAAIPELGADVEAVRRALRTSLEATGKFAIRERHAGDGALQQARVRLEVESARRIVPSAAARLSGSAREAAEVAVLLELLLPVRGGELDRLVAEGLSRRPTAGGEGRTVDAHAFEDALGGALAEAAVALVWQLEARRKGDAELLRDLGAADPGVRESAMRALADRRNPAAVPFLVSRLDDESATVVRRAVGALVAIGDRRAVRPLIEQTRKRPPQLVAEILYALGSLGGGESEALLYTLESGALDEEVRRAAAEALAELRRKREETVSAPGRRPIARPGAP